MVAAIEVHDEQVLEQDRRGAGAAIVIALQVAPFPERLAGLRVETGGASRAERDVNAARLDDRRGRAVGVELVGELRLLDGEELEVVNDLAGVAVHADGEQIPAILGGGVEPDLIPPDDGRRPGASVNGRLPLHVVCLAPGQGQTFRGGMSVAIRATILRPVVGSVGCEATSDEKERGTDYSRASSIRREEALLSLSLVTSAATPVRLTHTIGGRWIH